MLFKRSKYKSYDGEYDCWYLFIHNNVIKGQFNITNTGYIFDLSIYEEYRDQGLGTIMLKELVEKFGSHLPLNLYVLTDNKRARRVYEKSGFVYIKDDKYSEDYALRMVLK